MKKTLILLLLSISALAFCQKSYNYSTDTLKSSLASLVPISNAIVDSLALANKNSDSLNIKRHTDNYVKINQIKKDLRVKFIRSHPANFESLKQLESFYDMIPKNIARDLYNGLSRELKEHSIGLALRLQLFDIDDVLKEVITFSLPDTSNKVVNIDSLKNEYLLIDFWASWCGPCRKETPTIKKAYDKYGKEGFEIVAVSLDIKRKSWVDAINKDGMNWINLSDLNGWDCIIANKYGIRAIPANFLLDKNRKIIAKDLRGEDLMIKLKELYKY